MVDHAPRYIFLDQNHWIYLARALSGRPQAPPHTSVAATLLGKVDRDEVRLPLSSLHLIEHLRAERPARRRTLAEVYERVSQGWFIAGWSDVLRAEINRAVAMAFGAAPPHPPQIFGRGFLFGVGTAGRSALLAQHSESVFSRLADIASRPGALLDLLTFP